MNFARGFGSRTRLAGLFFAGSPLMAGVALADPYSLPIASDGASANMSGDVVSPATRSLQTLAAQVGLPAFTASGWHPGLVRHIVLIAYRPSTTAAERAEVTARFLHLAQDSRRSDGTRVVESIETGMQNSGEGVAGGYQQAFLLTFRSEGDRNFYVGKPVVTDPAYFDPAHEAFKTFLAPLAQQVMVFDYDVLAADRPGQATDARKSRRHR